MKLAEELRLSADAFPSRKEEEKNANQVLDLSNVRQICRERANKGFYKVSIYYGNFSAEQLKNHLYFDSCISLESKKYVKDYLISQGFLVEEEFIIAKHLLGMKFEYLDVSWELENHF